MASKAPAPQLSKDEVRFLERQLAELPTTKSEAGQNDSDGLLKFSYHQNPYVRTFTKVLWSGFAISRGQLVDGSQRFAQARRDATVSAIDASTTKSLDNAAAYAGTGVDYLAVGALTHSVRVLDVGLDL